ncbi:hypothetical protein OROGR_014823 [Orobanche gracilis]
MACFNEKIKVNAVFLRDSTAVSDSVLLLFGGSISRGDMDGHLKMLGGYLEFYMDPSIAELYQSLKGELDELIQTKLQNPNMDIHAYHELLSVLRLLISEDQCGGKFIFNRQLLRPSIPTPPLVAAQKLTVIYNTESGPVGDNSKSQLQTLLTRAGYAPPSYKTNQLQNNQFRTTFEFNSNQITGRPAAIKNKRKKMLQPRLYDGCWVGMESVLIVSSTCPCCLKKARKITYPNKAIVSSQTPARALMTCRFPERLNVEIPLGFV